jgi:hypothetical protein
MNEKQAIKKYGKETFKLMLKEMAGNTVGINKDGSTDYYDWDLERAYNIVVNKTHYEDFD